tara:strand:- start:495 stop:905 length:411 start_codon:yes stop_codon:yes gene_type:complete
MNDFSSWTTNKRYGWAHREAGQLTLVFHRGVYLLLSDKVMPIEAPSLAEAIAQADSHLSPPDWSYVVGMWLRPGWKVQKGEAGWKVYGEDGEPKSQKVFKRADMARKWCEIRQDRVGINLRGPKPKNTSATEPSEE